SLKTSIKTITYLSDIGCLEIQGASLKLEERIDEKLRGLGSYEYEEQPEEDDEDSEPESEINITPTED
ncbi:hypothetical protein AB7Z19_27050, partial [Escherichia coli]